MTPAVDLQLVRADNHADTKVLANLQHAVIVEHAIDHISHVVGTGDQQESHL